jgi:hypothetical protein
MPFTSARRVKSPTLEERWTVPTKSKGNDPARIGCVRVVRPRRSVSIRYSIEEPTCGNVATAANRRRMFVTVPYTFAMPATHGTVSAWRNNFDRGNDRTSRRPWRPFPVQTIVPFRNQRTLRDTPMVPKLAVRRCTHAPCARALRRVSPF